MNSLYAIARTIQLAAIPLLLGVVTLTAFTVCPAFAQAYQRPLSDFVNAQGSTTCFTAPVPGQLGWTTGPDKTNGSANLTPPRFALFDYAGAEARYLLSKGINLGTTVSGSVQERRLADGTALVSVDLQTQNALGWAVQNPTNDTNTDPLAFGSRAPDVLSGAVPALGQSQVHVQFVNTAPGAPLPDLICINAASCTNDPNVKPCPDKFALDSIQVIATIKGLLHAPVAPEGTPGQLEVTQIGPIKAAGQTPACDPSARNCPPLWDGFPVESIGLKTLGK